MTAIVDVGDLPATLQNAEMIDLMVNGVNAQASRVAPCLAPVDEDADQPTEDQLAEARLVLVGAVKRWSDAGSGALQSQQAGPFATAIDTRQRTGWRLWPSEIKQLQEICSAGTDDSTSAFSITPTPSAAGHAPWCDLMFGGLDCSCGYSLSGADWIYEPE